MLMKRFEDARQRIRRGFEDDLSPFNDPAADPAANYQKGALLRIVRISEDHPLETNQKSPECMTSGRNALGRTDFIKASSCLDAETRK
jgi:hypothetical protein